MNNEASSESGFSEEQYSSEELKGGSKFIESVFGSTTKMDNSKIITISKFFDCNDEAKFVVAIAKYATLFNISINEIECLQKLSKKQISYIESYNFESVLADTNRKQFCKFFQKSTYPQLSLHSPFSDAAGAVLVIQYPQHSQEKPNIKIINYENLIQSIISNVNLNDGLEQLGKIIDSRFKKISAVACFEQGQHRSLNKQLISFLVEKFNQVFYMRVDGNAEVDGNFEESQTWNLEGKQIRAKSCMKCTCITTHQLSAIAQVNLCELYNRYRKIDEMINSQVEKSKISKTMFQQNELCISFYGLYYNFITLKQLEKEKNSVVQSCFLEQFISEKEGKKIKPAKVEKKMLNRKLGHYPAKILKGSKVCCVCQENKKKKSRFKCEKCSDTYSRDIALCIDHFKEYHDNMYKYIPKGVRKGAYKNELMSLTEVDKTEDPPKLKPTKEDAKPNEVEKIFESWQQRNRMYKKSFDIMAELYLQSKYPQVYELLLQNNSQTMLNQPQLIPFPIVVKKYNVMFPYVPKLEQEEN